MINTNTAVLEFEDNWGKSTETKAPDKPVRIAPPVNKDLIDEEEPEPEPEPISPEPANTPVSPEPVKIPGLSSSLSAEMTSMGIDTIQSITFRLINNRKIVRRIGKENIERFSELLTDLQEQKKRPENLSDADATLFWKFKRLKQIEEDIPFTNDEYDKLNELLDKYYKETGKSMPAWLGLSIALVDVLGGRLSDALTE